MPENKAKRAKRQAEYNSSPKQKKRRAARNKARRMMIAKYGKAAVAGKDVGHRDGNPRNNSKKNLKIESIKSNRGRDNNKGRKKKK